MRNQGRGSYVSSQDGVTGTGLTLLPETTKKNPENKWNSGLRHRLSGRAEQWGLRAGKQMRWSLGLSQFIVWRELPGCSSGRENQGESGDRPDWRRWSWDEGCHGGWNPRGTGSGKSEGHREPQRSAEALPEYWSLHMKKPTKGRERRPRPSPQPRTRQKKRSLALTQGQKLHVLVSWNKNLVSPEVLVRGL